MDLASCTPSASAMMFSSHLSAMQTPRRLRSLSQRPGTFARPLLLRTSFRCCHGMSHNPRSCLCASSATVRFFFERFAFSPEGLQPLQHRCLMTTASNHSRGCFPSSLLCHAALLKAVIACSLFSLIRTLFLSQNSTPSHMMLTRCLLVPLSLTRLIVDPDSQAKMLDTVISSTVSHLASQCRLFGLHTLASRGPDPSWDSRRAFHKSLPNEQSRY